MLLVTPTLQPVSGASLLRLGPVRLALIGSSTARLPLARFPFLPPLPPPQSPPAPAWVCGKGQLLLFFTMAGGAARQVGGRSLPLEA